MARMQSVQSQCCCCSFSLFSALFGIIMLSTGICLVLNYRIMEVDTTGLPPEWQNEEGKKIVGIILICVGLGGMGLSALVTALYFTVCSRTKTTTSVMPSEPAAKTHTKHPVAGSTDPHSTEIPNNHHSHSKHSSSRHGKRPKKKRPPPQLKGYKTKLPPHQEDVNEGGHDNLELDASSRSLDSSQTSSSKTNSYMGDSRKYDSQDVMESSFDKGNPPFVIYKPEASDHSGHKVMLKAKPEDGFANQVRDQPLLQIQTHDFTPSANNQMLLGYKPVDHQTHSEQSPMKAINGDLSLNRSELFKKDSDNFPNPSGDPVLLKSLPPPPLQSQSLALDSDEEVSQIEEIKQLDKDVANLLE